MYFWQPLPGIKGISPVTTGEKGRPPPLRAVSGPESGALRWQGFTTDFDHELICFEPPCEPDQGALRDEYATSNLFTAETPVSRRPIKMRQLEFSAGRGLQVGYNSHRSASYRAPKRIADHSRVGAIGRNPAVQAQPRRREPDPRRAGPADLCATGQDPDRTGAQPLRPQISVSGVESRELPIQTDLAQRSASPGCGAAMRDFAAVDHWHPGPEHAVRAGVQAFSFRPSAWADA